jgi:hypothetical protein
MGTACWMLEEYSIPSNYGPRGGKKSAYRKFYEGMDERKPV